MSPDQNTSEHMWKILRRSFAARRQPPATIPQLRFSIQEEWAIIPQQPRTQLRNDANHAT